ncbi:MAG: MBL fold metallo-hydrolase [bacterium]|nr:MBL fold metallo-hydrolase [bacterium]
MRSVALLGVLVLFVSGCERMIDRQIEKNLGRADTALLQSPDMTVLLCGTGSPLPDPNRASACTAIVAGGEIVLVDTGPGSWEQVDLANLPTGAVGTVLLTHLHSDHIGDLGEAMTQSWIGGRKKQLDVYGPPGTARVVEGFDMAYSADEDARTAHHTEQYMPRGAANAVAHELVLGPEADASTVVFERNGLKVIAFRVDHAPIDGLGYRIEWKGRSVVLSGDTKKSASVVKHATGADILIHEALQPDIVKRSAGIARRMGNERLGHMANDILDYHTSVVEAAEVARDAKVPHLVLSHLVPAPTNWFTERIFLRGAGDVYAGEITVGADGMRFTLPPRPTS